MCHLRNPLLFAAGATWLALLITGFGALTQADFVPVNRGTVSGDFPTGSRLHLDAARPTLILFAHPKCPCTWASFDNLTRLRLEAGENHLAVVIVFAIPRNVPAGWERGELWSLAEQMSGVQVYRDTSEIETRRFGATGSGQVFLYAPSGRLLFSGGITSSRARPGDNLGSEAILRSLKGQPSAIDGTPVFGCSLL